MLRQHKTIAFFSALFFLTASCGSSNDEDLKTLNSSKNENIGLKSSPDGMAVFRKYCVTCHGADGKLGLNGAKDLTKSTLNHAERVSMVAKGKNLMTPFEAILSPEEIEAVVAFTLTLKAN